jgi:hypothetical protein
MEPRCPGLRRGHDGSGPLNTRTRNMRSLEDREPVGSWGTAIAAPTCPTVRSTGPAVTLSERSGFPLPTLR